MGKINLFKNQTKKRSMPAGKPTTASKSKAKARAVSSAKRAGVMLPPTKIMKLMKRDRLNKTIRRDSSIYMAGVLEYLAQEIFELSGEIAKKEKKARINPRHIKLALSDDEELFKIFGSALIHEGGVVPHIEQALLPKKGKKGAIADQSQVV